MSRLQVFGNSAISSVVGNRRCATSKCFTATDYVSLTHSVNAELATCSAKPVRFIYNEKTTRLFTSDDSLEISLYRDDNTAVAWMARR
jgi:hypothetical protein